MEVTIVIPNRRMKEIEPHCLDMCENVRRLRPEFSVLTHPCPALIDFFRSEAMERAFLHGADVMAFVDSDCSCQASELVDAIDLGIEEEAAKSPLVQVAVFPMKEERLLPPEDCKPIGRYLDRLKFPVIAGKRIERQIAPTDCLFGGGCVIVNRSAWKKLCERFPMRVRALSELKIHPLWRSEMYGEDWLGEDYSFFLRCHHAGVPVMVESIRLGHGYGNVVNHLW